MGSQLPGFSREDEVRDSVGRILIKIQTDCKRTTVGSLHPVKPKTTRLSVGLAENVEPVLAAYLHVRQNTKQKSARHLIFHSTRLLCCSTMLQLSSKVCQTVRSPISIIHNADIDSRKARRVACNSADPPLVSRK